MFRVLLLASTAAAAPAFPGAASQAVLKISDVLTSVSPGGEGNSDLTAEESAEARAVMSQMTQEAARKEALAADAYGMVHDALVRSLQLGGCPRRDANGVCVSFLRRDPDMSDVMEIAVNADSAAHAYLDAARAGAGGATSEEDAASVGAAGASSGGCIRDYSRPGAPCMSSFVKESPLGGLTRPLLARTSQETDQDGSLWIRKTQAPMVWFHFHA